MAYPLLHFPVPAPDHVLADDLRSVPPALRFTADTVAMLVRNYVGRLSALPPLALPGHGVMSGLPPVSIVLSDVDDLRPSGELFVEQLREAGVLARVHVATGMLHGHLNIAPTDAIPEIRQSIEFLVNGLPQPNQPRQT